jgi:hypothetical protein
MRLDTVIVTPGDSPGWQSRGGDFYVATSGDFLMATDRPSHWMGATQARRGYCDGHSADVLGYSDPWEGRQFYHHKTTTWPQFYVHPDEYKDDLKWVIRR